MAKRTRRAVWSMIVVVCMLLSMLPTAAIAAEFGEDAYTATVYVGSSGNNANDGKTEETAVKTMTAAYEKLYALMEAAGKKNDETAVGRIVVTKNVSFSTTTGPTPNKDTEGNVEHHAFTIVVTGKTPDLGLNIKNDYLNLGPTVYENITLTKNSDSTNLTYFCANGYPLVIGENVTTVPKSNGYNFCLVGGFKDTNYTGDSSLTVHSGTWRNIYVGNYKGDMTGDASLVMTGGEAENTICSTYNGSHTGQMDITITGGSVKGILYGGNSYTTGEHSGDISISVSGGVVVDGDIIAGGRTGLDGDIRLDLEDVTVTGGVSAECSGTAVVNLTASKGNCLAIGSGALEVNAFTGGGTLSIGQNVTLNMAAVTGSTRLSIDGTPYNMTYLTAPDSVADDAFQYVPSGEETMKVTAAGGVKSWAVSGGKDLTGLKLVAPEDVTVSVSSGFSAGAAIAPSSVTVSDGTAAYLFVGLEAGNYCYTASGNGYYTLKKNFIYTKDETENGKTVQVNPGKMAGNGFEPTTTVSHYTDGVLDQLLTSSTTQWEGYEHIFETPAFTIDRADHQQTTQDEMMDFLEGLDQVGDNMYLYILGTSPVYGYEVPVVVFTKTDLSRAATLEEAAALVKANEKATIHYQAEIHPNEPAGGEGALAMIRSLDGAYGEKVLDTVNIYVIPRINGDGANLYQRANVAQNIDMNRDHLYVQSKEVEMVHYVYNLFMPEVAIDGHEFNATTTNASSTLDDVQVGAAGSLNSSGAVNEIAQDMVHTAFDNAFALGLRPYNYGSYASTVNNAIGRAYYGLYGSLSFLIETRGIGAGLGWFERRVMSQYVVTESFIDYVVENEEAVRTAVAQGRQELVEKGALYGEEGDIVVLTHDVSGAEGTGYVISRPTWDLGDGSSVNPDASGTIYRYDIAKRSRPRPTAYVIPKGEAWAQEAIAIMDKNGISYYELEAGSTVWLQQYLGNATSATLTGEMAVTFGDGAYVLPMNQVGANVLAMTMEPDVTDSAGYNGTLVQSGVVSAGTGVLPIYRYIHDLDENGRIGLVELPEAPTGLSVIQPAEEFGTGTITGLAADKAYEYRGESDSAYIPVPAGSTEISGLEIGVYYVRYAAAGQGLPSHECQLEVIDRHITSYRIYVDGVRGDDSASGRKSDTAVATLGTAYAKLAALMKYAPQGTEGTIIFQGTVTLDSAVELPDHDYTVVLTSATGAEGIASGNNIDFNGDTRLKDMSVTLLASGLRYIAANGHDLVFDEGVTCNPSGNYYYNLVGGGRANAVAGDTNLTVKSGSWRNIYVAGYTGNLTGNANLTMTGGNVTAVVQTSYSGQTTGNTTIRISGARIGGNIFGGNTNKNDLAGDTTILLGEGAEVASVYGGSRTDGDVLGTATIILDGAQVQGGLFGGCADASNTVAKSVIILKSGNLAGTAQADRVLMDTSGEKELSFSGDLAVDEITGGGNVTWEAGKVLTVQTASLTGTTRVTLTGQLGDAYCITAPKAVAANAFAYTGADEALCAKDDGEQRFWYLSAPVTVTFMDGEAEYASQTLGSGGLVSAPADPGRSGFLFTGWYLEGELFDFTLPVDHDLVLTAGWEKEKISANQSKPAIRTDVEADSYYSDAVAWALEKGITAGTGETTFSPDAACTRAQAVTFLWRASGSPAPQSHTMPFTDVAADAYYHDAVLWAVEQGITKGTSDTTFTPGETVTRAQAVTFLWRTAASPDVAGSNPFEDVASDAYYANAVLWAVANGITTGTGTTTFTPNSDCTRAQIVTFLYRYMGK